MSTSFAEWIEAMRTKRQWWVDASHENGFERGLWSTTVEKYADPSHFIFELLQNAEDAGATAVRFELLPDRIIFEHDGRAFNREDIDGITGIGNTTKLDEGHQIGCFGIGFKSVYVVTDRPEVHSEIEGEARAFAIDDLVVPRLVDPEPLGLGTRFILPLRPDKSAATLDHARSRLISSGAGALLFLEHIKSLAWVEGTSVGRVDVADSGDIRSVRSVQPNAADTLERFLLLRQAVEEIEGQKQYEVKAALRLNAGGQLIPEGAPTRLRVFFETEELTGLHFLIHGPFQLTDNRGNIKRDDPWNMGLIERLAHLVADALPALRDRGLLTRSLLELLPNANDELPPTFAPMLPIIAAKFTDEALIPVHGSTGFTTALAAVRGPVDLRDLLGTEGLDQFAGLADKNWITTGLRNSREDHFLNTVHVGEFGSEDFFIAFDHAFSPRQLYAATAISRRNAALQWFNALSDELVQAFYLALDAAIKPPRRPTMVSNYPFIRLADGHLQSPQLSVIAPADTALAADVDDKGLYIVKGSLLQSGRTRGKQVEHFLRRMNVKDIDDKALIAAIIRADYTIAGHSPNSERHLQHMRRFLAYWKETGDVAPFAGIAFLRAENVAGLHEAVDLYLSEPFQRSALDKVYDGSIEECDRAALWKGYDKLRRKDLMEFVAACGVATRLMVIPTRLPWSHPNFSQLYYGFGTVRRTDTETSRDHQIAGIVELLKRADADISRLIWDAMNRAGVTATSAAYAPNQSHLAHQSLSSLAIALRDAAWIPLKNGNLQVPRACTAADLAAGFALPGNEQWLRAIGFGDDQRERSEEHRAVREAGELIGLPEELVEQLQHLAPEARQALSADILRKIAQGHYQSVEFPEKESRDPTHRANRMAERAKAAPAKTYAIRERSVRTSRADVRQSTRAYLADQYTNAAAEMVCQICHDKMPFNLPDGTPFFEACQLLDDLSSEQAEAYLSLCPLCAAKWSHACQNTDEELRTLLAEASGSEILVELAGNQERLRFTRLHMDDVRIVCGIGPPGEPS